jgi:hypothetical protein
VNTAIRKHKSSRLKKASEGKSRRILSLPVDIARLKVYQDAADKGFRGNLCAFLLAAADDLAPRLTASEAEVKRERDAFLRAAADALNAHLAAKAKRHGRETSPSIATRPRRNNVG